MYPNYFGAVGDVFLYILLNLITEWIDAQREKKQNKYRIWSNLKHLVKNFIVQLLSNYYFYFFSFESFL